MQVNSPSLAERPLTASSPPPHEDVRLMIPLFGGGVLLVVLCVAAALYYRRKAERKRYENYAYSGKNRFAEFANHGPDGDRFTSNWAAAPSPSYLTLNTV